MRLDDFCEQEDEALIGRWVEEATPQNWHEFEVGGLPVGRFAAFELILNLKSNSLVLPEGSFDAFRDQLRNVLRTYLAAPRILDVTVPDRSVTYNSLYGVNRIWQALAEARGIPCYSLHASYNSANRLDTLMMYRDDNRQLAIAHTADAAEAIERPISASSTKAAFASISVLLDASNVFVYSLPHAALPPDDVRSALRLRADLPVFLAPLSSADERFGLSLLGLEALQASPNVFASQRDWVKGLKEIAERHPEWQIIVRLHPRMFPNRREGQAAPEAPILLAELADSPSNLIVNTPSDGIGVSDLLQVVDVGLAGTSSVGMQMLASGIPIVVHDPELVFSYPGTLGRVVASRSEYESAMIDALAAGWSPINVKGVMRWLAFLHQRVARPVHWHTRRADGNPDSGQEGPATQRSLARRMASTIKPFVPKIVRLAANDRHVSRATQALSRMGREGTDVTPFEYVLLSAEDGLHRAPLAAESHVTLEAENEATDWYLSELLDRLGRFPDEPNSLSSRIARHLQQGPTA
jgi:hypothetical protein